MLGSEKSFSSPKLELTAKGMAQCTDDQSRVWYPSAILAPQEACVSIPFLLEAVDDLMYLDPLINSYLQMSGTNLSKEKIFELHNLSITA